MSSSTHRLARARRSVAIFGLALLVAGCPFFGDDSGSQSNANEWNGDSDQQSETVCGMETLPSPANVSSATCTNGESVVQETFTRSTGPPDRASRSFETEAPSELCLTVQNGVEDASSNPGRGGPDGLAAAWVYVDDRLVFGPDHFDPNVDKLRETVDLQAGSHEIRVKLASKPGASMRVHARVGDPSNQQQKGVGEKGLLVVENIAVDHPLFSPNDDGYHETALFNADNIPRNLPGKRSGRFSYSIDWEWTITNADTCREVDARLSGTTPMQSRTNVHAKWDGTDRSGSVVPDGPYLYQYNARLVRSDGKVLDRVTATARGVVVDTTTPDYKVETFDKTCDPASDPHNCKCPNNQTSDGTQCRFAWIPNLTSFESPSNVDTSAFLTSRRDESTGRWEVVVDLRRFNGGGLVPQTNGTYSSLEELQSYVAELTGVPADPDQTRLFNFDYTQLGYSTPVVRKKGTVPGFNHFLLDVITNASGQLTIDGRTINLRERLDSTEPSIPNRFRIENRRRGEECGYNGNTDGADVIRAKSCTDLKTANLDPGESNLGIYIFQKRLFGVDVNGRGTERDGHCIINGILKCGVRTYQRNVDSTFASRAYAEDEEINEFRSLRTRSSSVPALVTHVDRGWSSGDGETTILDGICSDDSASRDRMTIPLDSGAGALPDTCIINGIL